MKNGYIVNLEAETVANTDFRRVLYTAEHMQLVLMSLFPKEEIGEETHELDQFIRVDHGVATVVLNGQMQHVADGYAIVIPAGTKHNIINDSEETPLKLYTIYAPPEHKDKTVHVTKADALLHEEHFDGKTTE